METASSPSLSAMRSATWVISARLHCAGRPTPDRSGRIQMLVTGSPALVIRSSICDRCSQNSMLDLRTMYANGRSLEMGQRVEDRAATTGRVGKLPQHVRFFLRQSRKGVPAPLHEVRVERGLQIPMPDGTRQLADRYSPVGAGPYPTLLVRTPYGRGFPYDYAYGALFAEQGFHVVIAS